jgi:hypothetical protein
VLFIALVRDHQFIIICAELYVAICHIAPPPPVLNRVYKTDREVVTDLERKGCREEQ